MQKNYDALIAAAKAVRARAYAPYSHYSVGAALLSADGEIFTGCNWENASYPAGMCAERAALSAAIAAGKRKFLAMAVYGETGITPCGLCRQALSEFGDLWIILASEQEAPVSFPLSKLLPGAFQRKKKEN